MLSEGCMECKEQAESINFTSGRRLCDPRRVFRAGLNRQEGNNAYGNQTVHREVSFISRFSSDHLFGFECQTRIDLSLIQNIVVHNCPSSSKWKHMIQTCSRTCAETPTQHFKWRQHCKQPQLTLQTDSCMMLPVNLSKRDDREVL